ncbi:sensor protein ZraS [bacterium BMS3Bbin08]|nr:sensor protein ZraS [bacterium BMS3Bbin08]
MQELTGNKSLEEKLLETEILIKVAQVANSSLDLREILDTITKIIAESLKKDVCSIYLPRPGNKIYIEATKGLKEEAIGKVFFVTGEGIVGWVARELKYLAVENIREEPRFKDVPVTGASDFLSMLAVPIIRENKLVGVITLQTRGPYIYSQDEINLLTIISYNISSAIRNAKLYRSVKTQLDELKIIHEVGKATTSILTMDELLPYICEEVSKLFHSKGCVLRLLEGENLQIKASYGLPDKIKHAMNLHVGNGIAGWVAQTGKPLLVDNVADMPENLRVPVIEATSALCVPLHIGGRVIGTLGLYDKKGKWGVTVFSRKDLDTLETFADASSIAIENARLYKIEVEKEKKILTLYWEVARTKDYLESLIDNSADAIVTSGTGGLITSWNKGAEKIYGFTEDEVLGKFLPMVPAFLIEKEKQSIEKILQKETVRNVETIRQKRDGQLIEVSLTLSPVLNSAGEVTAISGISRDISEQKRIEKALIRKNQELSKLFFINSVVRSTLELDKLLRMVLTVVTMSDGLGFNRAVLFLVDETQNTLKGVIGVGPESPEEAGHIWLSLAGKSLKSSIDEIEKGHLQKDSYLDRLSRELSVDLDEDCVLTRCIKEKTPFNIRDAGADPLAANTPVQRLGTKAFGVAPLITRDRAIGAIFLDNLFTGREIKDEDLEFLLGFTSHMASAIENARLFEEISRAQAELTNIFESISDMVYFSDRDFTIRNINQAVVEKVGKPAEEILGKKCYEIFHGTDRPPETCPHAKAMTEKKAFVEELEDHYLDGTFFVSSSPIFDSAGNFVGTVNVSRDITELNALRGRVAASERMAALGEMAARVAHEIRNPLISVGGFARRLEKKLDGNLHEMAKIIVEEVSRLEQILKEILGFVRKPKMVKNKIDLVELIDNTLNFISSAITEKGNTLTKDLFPTPIMITVDRDRIREAILNIINNANNATDNGEITVKTVQQGNEALIEISDTGYGIRQEELKNIFTPFFTTGPHGTGLGLTITQRIVQDHKGRIDVESVCREPGGTGEDEHLKQCGTTFRIYLPLEE